MSLLGVAAAVVAGVLSAGCRAAVDPAAIADAQTVARIKTVLVNDPGVGEFAIEVRVVRGVAHLTGRVRSQAEHDRAVALARGVPGVVEVQPNLQIGGEVALPRRGADRASLPELESPDDFASTPSLFAVGAAVGWSIPRIEALKTRWSFSPLIKLGTPRGFGPAVGFDWYQADLESAGEEVTLTRVNIRPVMAGVGYTVAAAHVTLTPSVVAGYAFNSLTVTDTGVASGLPVEVSNSFIWRVGLSAWFDTTRRTALNASIGYLMTGLSLTVLENGRLEPRDASGDTAVVQVGLVYRLF